MSANTLQNQELPETPQPLLNEAQMRAEYRRLDQLEQDFKTGLDDVRESKREIAMRLFTPIAA